MKIVKLTDLCHPKQWKTISSKSLLESGYPVYGANGKIGYWSDYNHEDETLTIACRGTCGTVNIAEPKSYINGNAMCLDNLSDDVRLKYLYYYLKWYDMSKITTGTSIPQITIEGLKKIVVPLPDLSKQDVLIEKLDLAMNQIETRQAELSKMDNLIKARFVEMFGMPGTDTKGWGLINLENCCELNPKKGDDRRLSSGIKVSFIPMSAVGEHGEIDSREIRNYDEVRSGFTYFSENDVLFAKITPCMENGKGCVTKNLHNNIGFGSTEFHVLRPLSGISNPYWIYVLTSFKEFRKDAELHMTGSAGQRRTPVSFLANYQVTLPPIELQNKFASFIIQVDKSKFAISTTRYIYDEILLRLSDLL